MKAVIVYESNDGHQFQSDAECIEYEALKTVLQHTEAMLRKAIEGNLNFSGGVETYLSAELAAKYRECPRGIVGRFLSDGGGPKYDAICRLWNRRYAIDDQGREWGQPFFAFNPDKGTQVEWPTIQEAAA